MLANDLINAIAAACHMVNRAYCIGIGDNSQPRWEEAPEWQRDSARNGVRAVLNGGTAYSPEDSHKSWLAQKQAEGWTFGPVKDPEKKQHPCMVPYAELPEEQRRKDTLFLDTCYAVAHEIGPLNIPLS